MPVQVDLSRCLGPFLMALAGGMAVCAVSQGDDAAADPQPDFVQLGLPFIERHCVVCHKGDKPEGELALDGFRDADSVNRKRRVWESVLRRVAAGEMPPDDRPRPSVAEVAAFTDHIKALFDHADRHAKPDPGRVTMRRLNRTEYRNTVRDLLGIDFDPAEDFPADDIGHGFDNIGDVLSLPPVLMERYLAAAETIAARTIMPDPPAPSKRHLSSRYTEPAGNEVPLEGNWRVLASDGGAPIRTGALNAPYKWDPDGEYRFRTRVYANANGGAPVRVAILVHGDAIPEPSSPEDLAKLVGYIGRPARILETIEVKADNAEQAQVIEVGVPPMPGRERMVLAIVAPAEGAAPVKLYVEYFALDGPVDPRPASHRRLLACSPDKSQPEQTREVLSRLLRRAYRRPTTADEVERLGVFVDAQVAEGAKWEAAMQVALQAVLCSPKFLFRVEPDDQPGELGSRAVEPFALASRLSYFLWSSMPDDALLDAAESGRLAEELDAQVTRMLADPRADALVQNFAPQWLQIQRINTVAPDPRLFPQFDERLRDSMRRETELFFTSILREDRSILELLDADYTFLNEPLARLYGIADTNGNLVGQEVSGPRGTPLRGGEFQRVQLQGGSRGGLLTQASVLTVTSNPTRTSPVKRGRWVLEQILGEPPPPPPPNVPELPEGEQAAATGSLRERMEIHRRNPSCSNCHAKMDAIGFALENFDAIGAFRDKDGEHPIDPAGEFPDGAKFAGPEELKTLLRERRELFARCLTEKMLTYALGRGLETYDRPAVERIVRELAAGDHKFSVLVRQIAASEPFRLRRGDE